MPQSGVDITTLLGQAYEGREGAFDRVMERAYVDLRGLAEKHLKQRYGPECAGVTLEPAALVNETYLRLIRQRKRYDNRGQFFAIATRLMLRVLMDYHRSRSAAKRGGDQVRITLSGIAAPAEAVSAASIPDFVDALKELEKLDVRTAEVTQLRMIWGLTVHEVAVTLDVSERTVAREWRFARRWLASRLDSNAGEH